MKTKSDKIKQLIKRTLLAKKHFKRDLIVIAAVFAASVVLVQAGNLTPPGDPEATGYTLSDIYARLSTNATATEADHDFEPAADPASSLRTLTEIYEAIPTIDPAQVKLNTSYLGVAGTLTPDGGTAAAADLFSGKIAQLTGDWNLDTGTLDLACNTSTFDGDENLVANGYDGGGDGTNRWCMTNSGDALAGDLLSGKTAWVDGQAVAGSMANVGAQTVTPGTSNQTITQGYHDGTGYCAGDADLLSANIKSGANIFGVAGDSNVVDTSSGDTIGANLLSGKVCYSDGAAVAGSMTNVGSENFTPGTSSQTISEGYHDGTGTVDGDSDLETENIKNGTEIFNITGTYSGYPGTNWQPNESGDGSTVLTESACKAAAGWEWFEDANGDGDADDPEDGICIQSNISTSGSSKSWNGDDDANAKDNTYIAAYQCEGNFPEGSVSATGYQGVDDVDPQTLDTTWNDGDCALCQADCYDGKKDLPDNPIAGHYMPGEGSASPNHEGPLTPEILKNWIGTRLPDSRDFFGYCGYKDGGSDYYETDCSDNTTHGDYGQMIGRTDECMDLSNNGYEWLSEQHFYNGARLAGGNACSYVNNGAVYSGNRFRAVFRP